MTNQSPCFFDPDTVPWPTTWDDWVLCLCPEQESRVWVQHDLLAAMFPDLERFSEEYHDAFVTVGGMIGKLVAYDPSVALEGKARPILFTAKPLDIRVGRFGGEVFVFLPRPEFEP